VDYFGAYSANSKRTHVEEGNQILDTYIPLVVACALHVDHGVADSIITNGEDKLYGIELAKLC
jgi:hypothetical protein